MRIVCWSIFFLLSGLVAGGKPLPEVKPTPKTVLFAAQLFANTEVNQMLDIADELQARGHRCEFFLIEKFRKKVESRGFPFEGFPDPLAGGQEEYVQALVGMMRAKNWREYMKGFPGIVDVISQGYEPSLLALKSRLERSKPDVLFASMFADYAIDLATYYEIPTAIMYACFLGNIALWEDQVSTPDGFLWEYRKDHTSLWMRFRKIWRFFMMVSGTMSFGSKTNEIRAKHGIPTYDDPATNWQRAAVIVAGHWGLDVARRISPLTFPVGLISSPFDPNTANLSENDNRIANYLDSKTGGIVYSALGSLFMPTQDQFAEIIQGLDLWVQQGTNRGAIFAINEHAQSELDVSMVPETIQLYGWVDQKMILAHENTLVFATHGGLGSLSEAIVSQTPMLTFPQFADQMSNGIRLEEAGVGLMEHFRDAPYDATRIAQKLERLATEPSFTHALARQYQLSVRSGGTAKAADVVEDMMMFGTLDHLVPADVLVPFPANTNLDLYLVLLLVAATLVYGLYKTIQAIAKVVGGTTRKLKTE